MDEAMPEGFKGGSEGWMIVSKPRDFLQNPQSLLAPVEIGIEDTVERRGFRGIGHFASLWGALTKLQRGGARAFPRESGKGAFYLTNPGVTPTWLVPGRFQG